jgi:molybdenum cofactor cytidylyltransferase
MSRRVFALVLAAGQSRRMGRPKQLLPYRDGTIIEAVLDAVLESSVDGLCVVANHDVNEFLGDDLPERFVIARNNNPKSEMLESVQIGAHTIRQEFEAADDDGVMVLLADQPQVSGGLITTCAEAWRLPRKSPPGILIATYRGRRGHPTIFTLSVLKEIDDWPATRKLNELARLHADAVRELPITTAPMPLDINTPEDYERLQDS